MTGEKDPRDVMQAEHDARLPEHPAFQAPAELPGVEEIARALIAHFVENTGFTTVEEDETKTRVSAYYGGAWVDLRVYPMARAVLALFAPILAEKEREATDCAPYLKEGETPRERMDRDFKDSQALLAMLADERKKREATEIKLQEAQWGRGWAREQIDVAVSAVNAAEARALAAEAALAAERERCADIADMAAEREDARAFENDGDLHVAECRGAERAARAIAAALRAGGE